MKSFRRTMTALLLLAALTIVGVTVASANSEGTANPGPSNLTASLETDGVLLSWTPSTASDARGQSVLRWTGDNQEGEAFGGLTVDANTYTDPRSGLEAGQTYTYEITVIVEQDGFLMPRDVSNSVEITIPAEPGPTGDDDPAAPANPKPTDLSATVENGVVTLTWTPGSDPSYTEQLVLRREVGANSGWTKWNVGVDDTQMTDDSVESGKTYRYRVRPLKEDGGKGPLSDRVDITVP